MTYRTRSVGFLRHHSLRDWRLKLYGISVEGRRPPEELLAAGEALAAATLPSPATGDGRHGVGFVGVHEGAQANFVFVSWWAKLYELNHVLFRGPKRQPYELARVDPPLVGCTWDLRVVAFERDAWINSMVGDAPDLDTYLSATFESPV
jgi:hypothetical protein